MRSKRKKQFNDFANYIHTFIGKKYEIYFINALWHSSSGEVE